MSTSELGFCHPESTSVEVLSCYQDPFLVAPPRVVSPGRLRVSTLFGSQLSYRPTQLELRYHTYHVSRAMLVDPSASSALPYPLSSPCDLTCDGPQLAPRLIDLEHYFTRMLESSTRRMFATLDPWLACNLHLGIGSNLMSFLALTGRSMYSHKEYWEPYVVWVRWVGHVERDNP